MTEQRKTLLSVLDISSVKVNKTFTIVGRLFDDIGTNLNNANIYMEVNGELRHILTNRKGEFREIFIAKEQGMLTLSIVYKGNSNYKGISLTMDFPAN